MHCDEKIQSDGHDQLSTAGPIKKLNTKKQESRACKTGHFLAKHNTSTSKCRMDVHTKRKMITISPRCVMLNAHVTRRSCIREGRALRQTRVISRFLQEIIPSHAGSRLCSELSGTRNMRNAPRKRLRVCLQAHLVRLLAGVRGRSRVSRRFRGRVRGSGQG